MSDQDLETIRIVNTLADNLDRINARMQAIAILANNQEKIDGKNAQLLKMYIDSIIAVDSY